MVRGCEEFIAVFEEEILDALVTRKDNDSVEFELCNKITKACEDSPKIQEESDEVKDRVYQKPGTGNGIDL